MRDVEQRGERGWGVGCGVMGSGREQWARGVRGGGKWERGVGCGGGEGMG